MIFAAALRKELLEQWRSHRLLVVAVVLVAFGLSSPLLAKLMPEMVRLLPNGEEIVKHLPPPSVADAVAQFLKNMSQLGGILAVLTAMGAVTLEKSRGTAALVLVKPLPRTSFLLAKFVAAAATFTLSLLLASAGAYWYTLLLFERLDATRWAVLTALLLLQLLADLALVLLCSTLARSQAVAAGLAIGTLLLLTALGEVPTLGRYLPSELVASAARFASGAGVVATEAIWCSVALIATALAAACVSLARQEL